MPMRERTDCFSIAVTSNWKGRDNLALVEMFAVAPFLCDDDPFDAFVFD